jgi:hypothetical protein
LGGLLGNGRVLAEFLGVLVGLLNNAREEGTARALLARLLVWRCCIHKP